MNICINHLSNIITKIISSEIKDENIIDLFHYCKSLSLSYIINKYKSKSLYLKTISKDHHFLDDFAIDAVSTLFARDDKNRFHILIKYFKPYLDQIINQNEFTLILLRKLVVSKTKQEIIEYYKKENPSGWKIFRNIKEAPKRNNNIGVYKDFNEIYYYLFEDKSLLFPDNYLPQFSDINEEIIRNWISNKLNDTSKTPVIIEYVLRKLFLQKDFKKFISRDNLFRYIKTEMDISIVPFDENFKIFSNNEIIESDLLNKANLLQFLESIINKKYVVKCKISPQENDIYKDIVNDYFTDLINDGFTEKIMYYMNHKQCRSILKKDMPIHKNRVEYIIKLGKNYLKEWALNE